VDQGIAVYGIPGVPPAEAVITQDDEIGVTNPSHVPAGVRALLASSSPVSQ
jgi:ABC-type molybdate transport system substrate-binding protein